MDKADLIKLIAAGVGGVGALVGIVKVLITDAIPGIRGILDSRNVEKQLGGNFYSPQQIRNTFRYYIHPDCQSIDPAGAEEPRHILATRQDLFSALDNYLFGPGDARYMILLADSGMGKTSALMNYYARNLRRWSKHPMALVPLGSTDADKRIAEVTNKRNAVLLLDAFDEDVQAIVDHVERLRNLLRDASEFKAIVITCRTQFFAKDEEIPRETGILRVASRRAGEPAEYAFYKLYLSPFSDEQVRKYLRRRYRWQRTLRKRAERLAESIPDLSARPMLLAHIDDLLLKDVRVNTGPELYEEMIKSWIDREKGFVRDGNALREFSERVAVDLFANREARGSEHIPKAELRVLAEGWGVPLDEWVISGRSLLNRDASGNYKFAHRSIMEYLFAKRALAGDPSCFTVQWTDQMLALFIQMVASSGQVNSLGFLTQMPPAAEELVDRVVECLYGLTREARFWGDFEKDLVLLAYEHWLTAGMESKHLALAVVIRTAIPVLGRPGAAYSQTSVATHWRGGFYRLSSYVSTVNRLIELSGGSPGATVFHFPMRQDPYLVHGDTMQGQQQFKVERELIDEWWSVDYGYLTVFVRGTAALLAHGQEPLSDNAHDLFFNSELFRTDDIDRFAGR